MWKLWNSVVRVAGVRCNPSLCGVSTISDDDVIYHPSCVERYDHSKSLICLEQQQQQFKSSESVCLLSSYTIEKNGILQNYLKSASIWGWCCTQLGFYQELSFRGKQTTLIKAVANFLSGKPALQSATSQKINEIQPALSSQVLHSVDTLDGPSSKVDNVPKRTSVTTNNPTQGKLSIAEETNQTMVSLVRNLNRGSDMMLGDHYSSIGVHLFSSAQTGEISCYDRFLLVDSAANRKSAYQKEAFLCLQEAKKLGSTKGLLYLGIAFEQGWGTSVNFEKAAECYEVGAKLGNAKAQYNLGLLHFYGKLPSSDIFQAMTLLRQAFMQGLEQAWPALLAVLNNYTKSSGFNTVDVTEEVTPGSSPETSVFRKIQSEPHNFNYSSDGSLYESEEEESHSSLENLTSVSFSIGH